MPFDIERLGIQFIPVSTAAEYYGTSRHTKKITILHMIIKNHCNFKIIKLLGMGVTQSNHKTFKKKNKYQILPTNKLSHYIAALKEEQI